MPDETREVPTGARPVRDVAAYDVTPHVRMVAQARLAEAKPPETVRHSEFSGMCGPSAQYSLTIASRGRLKSTDIRGLIRVMDLYKTFLEEDEHSATRVMYPEDIGL